MVDEPQGVDPYREMKALTRQHMRLVNEDRPFDEPGYIRKLRQLVR